MPSRSRSSRQITITLEVGLGNTRREVDVDVDYVIEPGDEPTIDSIDPTWEWLLDDEAMRREIVVRIADYETALYEGYLESEAEWKREQRRIDNAA